MPELRAAPRVEEGHGTFPEDVADRRELAQ
jgi:hypothetical protein